MNRLTHRMCMAAAASMIMAAGGVAPTLAHSGDGQSPPMKAERKAEKRVEKREARAAKRAMERMERDLNRLTMRLSSDLRDAVQPHLDAMVDIAEAEHTSDDVDALVKTFQMSLDEASAAAMAQFDEQAAKRRADLVAKMASERVLAKADAMISRMHSRLERRADNLEDRFDDRLAELFEDYTMTSDDGECPHSGEDKPGDQPSAEEPPQQATPPEENPSAGDA